MHNPYFLFMEFRQYSKNIDYLNPLTAYETVREEGTYLLQSIAGEGKKARHTIIGYNPLLTVRLRGEKTNIEGMLKKEIQAPRQGPTIDRVRNIHRQIENPHTIDKVFSGGLVGYLGYETVYEQIDMKDTPHEPSESVFTLCRNNLIYDHHTHETILTENTPEGGENRLKEASKQLEGKQGEPRECVCSGFESNHTRQEFQESVEKIRHYIREGDIFQAVLSQKFKGAYEGDPYSAYKKLLSINPSPYMYYLDFGDTQIAGSSPETLVRVEEQDVYTYPIAGTRGRGVNAIEDAEMERELKMDEKEQAEHVMLVDLGRNDLGKVSRYGSVKVAKFMQPEYFSHVIHLSSEVKGKLGEDKDCFDALKAVFPAGTVSGAPKVRAMQIINELEPEARGAYAGCVGYFSFNQNMDTAITIRTMIFKDHEVQVQAGAGIVADSQPRMEYKETKNKARALTKCMGDDR